MLELRNRKGRERRRWVSFLFALPLALLLEPGSAGARTTLAGSIDMKDLGQNWATEFFVDGGESLVFRWGTDETKAAGAHWEVLDKPGGRVIATEKIAGAIPKAGRESVFFINWGRIPPQPTWYVRVVVHDAKGKLVGSRSNWVTIKKAGPQPGTTFRLPNDRPPAYKIEREKRRHPISGELLPIRWVLTAHSREVTSLAFSPNSKRVVSGSMDQTLKMWDVETGTLVWGLPWAGGNVWSVAFSPTGSMVATGGETKLVMLWDAETGKSLWVMSGHKRPVLSVSFSPDGKMIASGDPDNPARVWDVKLGKLLRTLSDFSRVVAISPNGAVVATADDLKLWDIQTGKLLQTLTGHKLGVRKLAFSPDGKILASGSADRTVKLWDADTGQLLRTLEHPPKGDMSFVTSVGFSSSGKTIASGSGAGDLRFWDAQSGNLLLTMTLSRVLSLAFSADGSALATGSGDGTVTIWNVGGLVQ